MNAFHSGAVARRKRGVSSNPRKWVDVDVEGLLPGDVPSPLEVALRRLRGDAVGRRRTYAPPGPEATRGWGPFPDPGTARSRAPR